VLLSKSWPQGIYAGANMLASRDQTPSLAHLPIFDAHLDLAYLACAGRDMHAGLDQLANQPHAGPDAPGCVSLSTLRSSPVRAALATVFIEPVEHPSHAQHTQPTPPHDSRVTYTAGNKHEAASIALAQLRTYQGWHREGLIELAKQGSLRCSTASQQPRIGILLEGADSLREPSDIAWWHAQGVVAVGLSWGNHSRYAAGNADSRSGQTSPSLGLTPLGRELVPMLDELQIVHDVSHLADASLEELLSMTNARVVATHSNCRALLPEKRTPAGQLNQRHLTDDSIREIARRGGVIGLNLFDAFLLPPQSASGARATIDHAANHVLHICELLGHAKSVGLGSDMDGGFSRNRLPVGIECPQQLPALLEALASRGMPAQDIAAFAHTNWERVFGGA
jgi:membrane dipeptidase